METKNDLTSELRRSNEVKTMRTNTTGEACKVRNYSPRFGYILCRFPRRHFLSTGAVQIPARVRCPGVIVSPRSQGLLCCLRWLRCTRPSTSPQHIFTLNLLFSQDPFNNPREILSLRHAYPPFACIMGLESGLILILGILSIPVAVRAAESTRAETYTSVELLLPTPVSYLPLFAGVVDVVSLLLSS